MRMAAALGALAGALVTTALLAVCLWDLTRPLRVPPPPLDLTRLRGAQTSILYASDGTELERIFYGEDRVDLPLEKIPLRWQQAFLAIEDSRFYSHRGVDLRAILRAAVVNLKSGEIAQGGSTITQQLVKLTLLTPEQTFMRKLQEAILAMRLERQLSKDEILERYLNQIYFGDGAYGVHAAALVYFGKAPDALTLGEMTLLAAVPNNPSLYHPRHHLDAARSRQRAILDAMVEEGYITAAEAEAALAEEVHFAPERPAAWRSPYVTSLAIAEALSILTDLFGSEEAAHAALFRGGLRIYTTVEPRVQAALLPAVEQSFAEYGVVPEPDEAGVPQPQAAVVVINVETGGVAGILGGLDWNASQLNRAFQALRQPGSAIKPLAVYAPALEQGYTLAARIEDRVRTYGDYTPQNWDFRYHGSLTLREALRYSSNTVAVELLHRIGVPTAISYLERIFTTLVPEDHYLPLALGGLTAGVTPLEMAAGYAVFPRGGTYIRPYIIARITDSQGNVLYEAEPERVPVFKPETAFLMTQALGTSMQEGTSGRASFGRPGGAKTGTSEENRDIWIAGFSPQYAAAVWVGHDTPTPMPGLYGSMIPARTFARVMEAIHEGLPVMDFARPEGVVKVEICRTSGLLATEECRRAGSAYSEWFTVDTVPRQADASWQTAVVCAGTIFLWFEGARCVPETVVVTAAERARLVPCPADFCGDPAADASPPPDPDAPQPPAAPAPPAPGAGDPPGPEDPGGMAAPEPALPHPPGSEGTLP